MPSKSPSRYWLPRSKRIVQGRLLLVAALTAAAMTFLAGHVSAAQAAEKVDFSFQVRPLLADRCFKCHGPDDKARKGKLRLDLPEAAYAIRDAEKHEAAVVPFHPEFSQLCWRVTAANEEDRMPPPASNLSLTSEEKELLRRWVEQGGEYKAHWAFIPVGETPVPPVADSSKVRNSVDVFVLARLQREGLKPAPEANRETLIRRLSFDLRGLPPSLKEVDDFLADQSADAYERLADRFLASPAYGEQQASRWLDLARYADTYGYQSDVERDLSPWRDWVIRASNENLPYDQFLLWQLAGDLLPRATRDQRLATAFNRLHRQTNEGGSVEEEFRCEYVADRVATAGTAFLGLTLGCARCHDHKYDPITQKDFYRMSAFFNNIDESGLYSHFTHAMPTPTLLLYPEGAEEKHTAVAEQIRKKEAALAELAQAARTGFQSWVESGARSIPQLKPAASFSFDEVKNDSTPDTVSTNRAAMLMDGPAQVEGKVGKALQFSGDNSLVCKGAGAFNRTSPFSFSLWLKPMEKQERAVVFHRSRSWTDSGSRGYELLIESGQPSFSLIHFWPGNAIKVRARTALPLKEWSHLTIAYDGSSRAAGIQLYLNGEPMATEPVRDHLYKDILHRAEWGDAEVGGIELTLAGRFRDSGFKNGLIDEFQVFDRTLTPWEAKLVASMAARPRAVDLGEGQPSASLDVSVPVPKGHPTIAQGFNLGTRDRTNPSPEGTAETSPPRTSIAETGHHRSPTPTHGALFTWYLHHLDAPYQAAQAELQKLREEENHLINDVPEIMVMTEMPDRRPTFLLKRGAYDAPGEAVEPGVPEKIFPFADTLPRNRLGLAKWMLDPRHPLTARVAVNRVWRSHFGHGLVETDEDFGTQGKLPMHPALLDWLARTFVGSGWDLKALHKLIVMSATYRQSSQATPELLARDPDNQLLARGPKHRLRGEEIRDNALAVSGLLSPRLGGASARPYQPEGLWEEAGTGKHYVQDKGEGLYRRSLYTFWRRTAPPPTMQVFDAPSREVCTARRETTTTPLQALVLLNDPQFVEAARVLAERLVRQCGEDVEARLNAGFRLATGRAPTQRELAVLRRLYDEQLKLFEAHPAAAEPYLKTGEHPLDKSPPIQQLAATTVVASTLMNLDEFVTER